MMIAKRIGIIVFTTFCVLGKVNSQHLNIGVNASFLVSDILDVPVDDYYSFVGLGIPLQMNVNASWGVRLTPSYARIGSQRTGNEASLRVTKGPEYFSALQFPIELFYSPLPTEVVGISVGLGSRYYIDGYKDLTTTTTILSTGQKTVTKDKGSQGVADAGLERWDYFVRMGLTVDVFQIRNMTYGLFFSCDYGLRDVNRSQTKNFSRSLAAEVGIRVLFPWNNSQLGVTEE